ncbi:MAG TPA: spore coat U domain-containing protein [Thermodesulfovibrionales bacterium]|nr:spore coat U domain-containing protein [Thermodesulfovibrionales bacterium]
MKSIKVLFVLAFLICSAEAYGQQCTVTSTAVNFGGYDVSSASPVSATGSVTVTCSPPASTMVKLDAGLNSGGSFNPRKMSGAGNNIDYNLYTDAACTMVWGDGTGNTFTQAGGSNVLVYGKIPALQNVRPGGYSDSVTIIVEF